MTSAARRRFAVLVLCLTATLQLGACRSNPAIAAYVGEDRVTTTQLQAAVDERLADPDVATYAAGLGDAGFTRQVLNLMIGQRVYDAVEQRYDVDVTSAEVAGRITELLAGQDQDGLFAQLAQQQGLVPDDAREIIRQLLVREEVAQAEGLADLSDAGLQAAYEDARQAGGQFRLGYITVPDQPTADTVVSALRADPDAYAALAAQYVGTYTLAAPQLRTLEELPTVLAAPVQGALPEGVFSLPVPETGGILVGQVTFPPIEDLAADLTDQARQAAADAGQPLVDDLEAGLDVSVNPRYGSLQDGAVVPSGDGVVQILEDTAAPGEVPAGD